METWQSAHIKENLPELLRLTICTPVFLAYFKSGDVLSDEDVEAIETQNGHHRQARTFYTILPGRTNGYEMLLQALYETKQTGALKIAAKVSREQISSLKIRLLEKTCRLDELLEPEQIKEIQEWAQENIPYKECKKVQESVLRLVKETIPAPDPLYIPRFLTRRQALNPALFNESCSDVFVFKGTEREQLRKHNKLFGIETSAEQLTKKKITCRFILLKSERHLDRIKSKVNAPLHVIKLESETEEFVVEETTGGSDILHKYLRNGHSSKSEYTHEDNFVAATVDTRRFCICDTPGMGKSLLLANLARKISNLGGNRIVSFLQLRELDLNGDSMRDPLSVIFNHISSSMLSSRILESLMYTNKFEFELFFDGLDEVQHENFNTVKEFVGNVHNAIPTAKIYITSRPVVRKELEQITKAISYDIQPFDENTQVRYLKTVWAKEFPDALVNYLDEYARICSKKLQESLSEEEKYIAGVPLLCKMIAEVFADEAFAYTDSVHLRSEIVQQQTFRISLLEYYQKYIERQLGKTECKFSCVTKYPSVTKNCNDECHVKSFHVFHALKLLWPNNEEIEKHCKSFEGLNFRQMFRPAILKQADTNDSSQVEFLHRTFAEYLVAEYIAKAVLETCNLFKPATFVLEKSLLNEFIRCSETVVVHFVNALMEDLQTKVEFVPGELKALSEEEFSVACPNCIENGSENVLETVLEFQKSSFASTSVGHNQNVEKKAMKMLDASAERCSISALKKIEQFYLEQYNFWILKPPKHCELELTLAVVESLRRADYEVAKFFVDQINLEGHGFLEFCLEYTYSESGELVEKRIDIARLLLKKWPSLINSKKEHSPLCAPKLHPKAIRFLIQPGENIRRRNSSGETFLHCVAKYMSEEEIQNLCHFIFVGRPLEDLFFIFTQEYLGLRFSFFRARALLLLFEVLSVANAGTTEVSDEAFEMFWKAGRSTTTQFSLEKSLAAFDPFSLSRSDLESLLFVSVEEGVIPLTELLLKHDKSLLEIRNRLGLTPLLLAADSSQLETFEFLVSKSANIFALDEKGRTILHIAAWTRDWKVFHRVLEVLGNLSEESAAVPASTSKSQVTSGKCPANLHELFNWRDKYSGIPLHIACEYLELPLDTLDLFLACGSITRHRKPENYTVDVNAVNSDGNTALLVALENSRSLEFVRRLVERGADWKAKDMSGLNAAGICAGWGLLEHLKYFVELGCDVNETDDRGNNALQIAVGWGWRNVSVELVEYLVSVGADKRRKNEKGRTAYDIAVREERSSEILSFLEL